jgi:hypothetical protein
MVHGVKYWPAGTSKKASKPTTLRAKMKEGVTASQPFTLLSSTNTRTVLTLGSSFKLSFSLTIDYIYMNHDLDFIRLHSNPNQPSPTNTFIDVEASEPTTKVRAEKEWYHRRNKDIHAMFPK